MMKLKGKTLRIFVCVLMVVCMSFAFAACEPSVEPGNNVYTVTFSQNYTGAPTATTEKVENGKKVTEPSAVLTRDGYYFTGWYTAAAATQITKYDFNTEVTGDLTLYAGWTANPKVTFDLNYPDSPNNSVIQVNKGALVQEPSTEPLRSGYEFKGWYIDETCTFAYDFSLAVNADMTLYASWLDETKTYFSVSFNLNYTNAPTPGKQTVEDGTTVSLPVTPIRNDEYLNWHSDLQEKDFEYNYAAYNFKGWYTDTAFTTEYVFSTPVTQALELFARWEATYDFEAELVDLTGITGMGYSFSLQDEQLIMKDITERNQNASMGHSIAYLYNADITFEFEIYSDRAVNGATLEARLTSEYFDTYISSNGGPDNGNMYESFTFQVNDGAAIDYGLIALTGTPERGTPNQRPFDNWRIGNINLVKGKNTIRLTVNNRVDYLESTLIAVAPLVDCLYVTTDASLDWTPKWENMDNVSDPIF